MSPYSFFIQLQLRKAKKIMITNPHMALKEVSLLAGFNDVSHFVVTFRKKEGVTSRKVSQVVFVSEGARVTPIVIVDNYE